MLQKIINKIINPYLLTKVQRIGFLLVLISSLICAVLLVFLDDYEDSKGLLIAVGSLLLGLYLMYFQNKVDAFINDSRGLQVNLDVNVKAGYGETLKRIVSANLTHFITIFIIAFSYSVFVEVWLGNFVFGKHKLDIFIAGVLGSTLVLAGIPILFGKYVAISFSYVVLAMMLFFNFYGVKDEKSVNEARALKIETVRDVGVVLKELHKQCEITREISAGACKGRVSKNKNFSAVCMTDLTTLFPPSLANWAHSIIDSPQLVDEITNKKSNYEKAILNGSYTESTGKDLALIAKTGSLEVKISGDCQKFEMDQSSKINELEGLLKNRIKLIVEE